LNDTAGTARPIKRRDASQTRARLLEVGETLFSEQGFDRTTLEAIANAADVNKAMIRYYYGDKAGLYAAIIEDVVAGVLTHLEATLPDRSDPVTDMADFIEVFAAAIISRPSFPRMILRDYLDGDIMSRPGPSATLRRFMETTHKYYEAGRSCGAFYEMDVQMLHLSIVSSAIFFSITERFRREAVRQNGNQAQLIAPSAFAKHLRRLILGGLKTS
jgi:TetR/AcrR family transcriptional regulator